MAFARPSQLFQVLNRHGECIQLKSSETFNEIVMEYLINKSALAAKIENRIKKLQNLYKEEEEKLDSIKKISILLCIDECKVILSLLDTLEVKEVDIEKEVMDWWNAYYSSSSKDYAFEKYTGHYLENSTLIEIARYFFELGLQVRKGG